MDRRHLLQATVAGAATPLFGAVPLAAAVKAQRTDAVPHDLAALLAPRRDRQLAGKAPSLLGVPSWRARPLRVPERYEAAYFSATDDRGGFYGVLPGATEGGDGVLILRGGTVTELALPGFRWAFARAANRRGDVVITAERVGAHGRTDSFLLRGDSMARFPHAESIPHVTAHAVSDDGLITGRYGEHFATWRTEDIAKPRLHEVPFRGGEPRQCFLGPASLVANVVSVIDSSYVADVHQLRDEWSYRVRITGSRDIQCWGAAGRHVILQVIDDSGYRSVVWDTKGRMEPVPGMVFPVAVNSAGLVAGYASSPGVAALLWHDGALIGKIVLSDPTDNAIILGISRRGEVFGRYEHADGNGVPVIWSRD